MYEEHNTCTIMVWKYLAQFRIFQPIFNTLVQFLIYYVYSQFQFTGYSFARFRCPACSGVETASHAGHCPINVVNVR